MYKALEFEQEHTVPVVLGLAMPLRTGNSASRGPRSPRRGKNYSHIPTEVQPQPSVSPPSPKQGRRQVMTSEGRKLLTSRLESSSSREGSSSVRVLQRPSKFRSLASPHTLRSLCLSLPTAPLTHPTYTQKKVLHRMSPVLT